MAFEHYDKCSLLLPMDGANNGTTFTDWSPNPKTITVNGNAKTVTAQSKHYGSSGYFDGSGDYLSIASHADFDLSTVDFTIAIWVYCSEVSTGQYNAIINKADTAFNSPFRMDISEGIVYAYNRNAANTGWLVSLTGTSVSLNTWTHIAQTKSGNTYRLFQNGVNVAEVTIAGSLLANSQSVRIGGSAYNSTHDYSGYLQDLLIIKGAALWTSDFTPPPRLIGTISGTTRDKDNALASRIVTAFPRTVPTKLYQTTSSAVDGTFSLRLPATESTALVMANESVMRNDIVDRIIPE